MFSIITGGQQLHCVIIMTYSYTLLVPCSVLFCTNRFLEMRASCCRHFVTVFMVDGTL